MKKIINSMLFEIKIKLIKKVMFYRFDMDCINDYNEIKDGLHYLNTLSIIDLFKILIEWKYNI